MIQFRTASSNLLRVIAGRPTASLLAIVGAWLAIAAHAIAGTAALGFVPVSSENAVYVIDTERGKVLNKIADVGEHPTVLRALPDQSKIYVDNFGPLRAQVSVIDRLSQRVIKRINTGGVPMASIQLSDDGKFLYIPTLALQLLVVDTHTDDIVHRFNLPTLPLGIDVSPDGRTLYVTFFDNTIGAYDATDGTALRPRLNVGGSGPDWTTISKDGSKIYLINALSDNVTVLDTNGWRISKSLFMGKSSAPTSSTLTPDGSEVYVSNLGTRNITVIRTADDSISRVIPTQDAPVVVGFAKHGQQAVLSGLGMDSVYYLPPLAPLQLGASFFLFQPGLPSAITIYDVASGQVVGRPITVGTGPIAGVYF